MNYFKAYVNLIRKARTRSEPLFYEKHHIFPESIYGKNSKIVKLSQREHYIAHALLYKIFINRYGIWDKRSVKMIYAFWNMNITRKKYSNSLLFCRIRSIFRRVRQKESVTLKTDVGGVS
jgi:hypothetical protein